MILSYYCLAGLTIITQTSGLALGIDAASRGAHWPARGRPWTVCAPAGPVYTTPHPHNESVPRASAQPGPSCISPERPTPEQAKLPEQRSTA